MHLIHFLFAENASVEEAACKELKRVLDQTTKELQDCKANGKVPLVKTEEAVDGESSSDAKNFCS